MNRGYFFTESDEPPVASAWGFTPTKPDLVLDTDLLESLRRSPSPDYSDAEVGVGLLRLAHDEFTSFGTGETQDITNEESYLVLDTLQAVLARLSFPPLELEWRDFIEFKKYWKRMGASNEGGYQKRRAMVDAAFGQTLTILEGDARAQLSATLVSPITSAKATGWPSVDEVITDMRKHFASATTNGDYSNIGNDAVRLLERLSATVYVHDIHGAPNSDEPPVDKTKDRLEAFVEKSLAGSDNAALRKLIRSSIEFAQKVKHGHASDRRKAGLAADATIMLANLLRRLDPTLGQ